MAKAKKNSKTVQWKFLKLDGILDRRFKVSNEGEIFNVRKGVLVNKNDMHKKSPINGTDYQSVSLAGKSYRLHRVVCETWHGPAPVNKNVVLHDDERKDNNNKDNLKWGTNGENVRNFYASRKGRPLRHSEDAVSYAKTLINKGMTNDKVATMSKIGDSSISLIKLGRSRKYVVPLTKQQIALGNI